MSLLLNLLLIIDTVFNYRDKIEFSQYFMFVTL